jgi:hypothetical protein
MAELSDPVPHAVAVTPSDSVDLPEFTTALYVGGSGDLRVTMMDGEIVTFTAAPAGWHPIRVRRVWSSGTTAASIVAVWQ